MSKAIDFIFPSIYQFPPFFTLQPHPPTREKQIKLWLDLIREYCQTYRIFTLHTNQYNDLELFHNKTISRLVSRDFFYLLLQQGVQQRYMQWINKEKVNVYVLWYSLEEWSAIILKWAKEHGYTNTVVTGYEIRCGELVAKEAFYHMEESMFRKVIQTMEKAGQLVMVNVSDVVDELGFKIIA